MSVHVGLAADSRLLVVVGRSQTSGLDLGCANLPLALASSHRHCLLLGSCVLLNLNCYFFDVGIGIPVIIAHVVSMHIMYDVI